MNIINSIILGIVQGLTEFLPVSSSGHLVIFQELLKYNKPGILFEIIVHIGTLTAVIVYFRKDIVKLIIAVFSWKKDRDNEIKSYQHMLLHLIIASIVTGIIGLIFQDILESFFDNILMVSIMLLVTGLILFISDKVKNTNREQLNLPTSLFIGFAQSIAIIPGISRSGSTISAGIFAGLKRDIAVRFAFLLSIPAIIGAVILKSKELSDVITHDLLLPYLLAGISAAIVGYLSISLLIQLIKKAKLIYFSIYCWIVGCLTIGITLLK
ncbi:MAG: undecaprenyl-diphosphatase UppP [Candidatus Cloacimonadota bacterium]|nr:undecaprenyl-diphosphatase UppP [Candidatus Cloacimonadota bacterium]